MKLKYIVNGIGIYIEYANKRWDKSVEEKMRRQLDGFQMGIDESKVKQKLIFKNYSLLDIESLKDGFVVPESSIYKDGLFVELELKIAFRIDKDNMVFWIHKDAWLSMPFILQFLFKQRNLTFVHGAGISVDDKGILLVSFGGVGKTAFISEAAKDRRVKILGDDLILVDDKGYLYPYLRPFCLYPYHEGLFPEYFKKNRVRYKKLNMTNRIIRKIKASLNIVNSNVYGYKTVAPYQLFEKTKIAEGGVPIDRVYLLRRRKGLEDLKCKRIKKTDKVVNFCVGVISHEWYSLAKMTFNLLVQKEESVSEYYKFFEDNIKKCISKTKSMYIIDIPDNMGAIDVGKEISKIVLEESI